MKKLGIIFTAFLLLLVTGCSFGNKANNNDNNSNNSGNTNTNGVKTMTCTKEEVDEYNDKTTETMVITYNSNKVLTVKQTALSEMDPEDLAFSYGFASIFVSAFNNIDGMEVSISKIGDNKMETVMNIDYDQLNLEQLEELNMSDEESLYGSNSYTIDSFRTNFLEGYSCK